MMDLLPPGVEAGAEVGLGPGGEEHHVAGVNGGVGEGEGEGGGAADDLALVIVLGTVARALELVLSLMDEEGREERGEGREEQIAVRRTNEHPFRVGSMQLLYEER